jgi:uncharacterized protein (DUF1330 family)
MKMEEEKKKEKAAYMVCSVNVREPDKLGPYMEAANPLFAAAGVELFALGAAGTSVQVLEGEWPFTGALQIYKCTSMDALLKFWNSHEYQEAKKLREGIVETNFTVAIDSTE